MGDIVTMQPHGAAVPVARTFQPRELNLIRNTVASDTNAAEFDLFIEVCKRVGLDPFRKQIYAVVYNKGDVEKRKMSIITGIDGYRAVAARSGLYRPDDQAPLIETDKDLISPSNPKGILRATVKAFRFGPDREWHPAVGVAYWDEYVPLEAADFKWVDTGETWPDSGKPKRRKVAAEGSDQQPSGKWAAMPHVMLAKCAEAQALRKGWPEDLSGVYVAEEMAQAEVADLNATAQVDAFRADLVQKQIGTAGAVYISWRAGEPTEAVPAGKLVDRCEEFFAQSESVAELTAWQERNRIPLRDFFARYKSDGLRIKELVEGRSTRLEAMA